jgi:hypothetical protein
MAKRPSAFADASKNPLTMILGILLGLSVLGNLALLGMILSR